MCLRRFGNVCYRSLCVCLSHTVAKRVLQMFWPYVLLTLWIRYKPHVSSQLVYWTTQLVKTLQRGPCIQLLEPFFSTRPPCVPWRFLAVSSYLYPSAIWPCRGFFSVPLSTWRSVCCRLRVRSNVSRYSRRDEWFGLLQPFWHRAAYLLVPQTRDTRTTGLVSLEQTICEALPRHNSRHGSDNRRARDCSTVPYLESLSDSCYTGTNEPLWEHWWPLCVRRVEGMAVEVLSCSICYTGLNVCNMWLKTCHMWLYVLWQAMCRQSLGWI